MKKKISIVLNCLLVAFIVFLSVVMIGSITNKDKSKPMVIFNHSVYVIATGSMSPTLAVGDIVLSKVVSSAEVDDIVTYIPTVGEMRGRLVTHRVVDKYVDNGVQMYVTRGDNPQITANDIPFSEDQLVSKVVTKLYVFSFIYSLFSTGVGYLFLVLIPLGIVFVSQIVKLVKDTKKVEVEDE